MKQWDIGGMQAEMLIGRPPYQLKPLTCSVPSNYQLPVEFCNMWEACSFMKNTGHTFDFQQSYEEELNGVLHLEGDETMDLNDSP